MYSETTLTAVSVLRGSIGISLNRSLYVIEELIQLTVGSDAEIIANSHWTEDLTYDFSLEHAQGS